MQFLGFFREVSIPRFALFLLFDAHGGFEAPDFRKICERHYAC